LEELVKWNELDKHREEQSVLKICCTSWIQENNNNSIRHTWQLEHIMDKTYITITKHMQRYMKEGSTGMRRIQYSI